jgi:NAD(P)-dependent dehydrogenase (short-subunit alcohol dehydrogenase family)
MAAHKVAGRVSIVTGASRGIGRELALSLARAGSHVVIAAKSTESTPELPGSIYTVAEEVEAIGAETGAKALPFPLDVRDDASIADMVATTVQKLGPPAVLINNASALWWKRMEDTPMNRYDLINSINSRGTFAVTTACLPHMREAGFGHVICQSPPIELDKLANMTAYSISKFGMTLVALGVAQEYRGMGIAGNSIWPATLIDSAATRNHALGSPEHWRKPAVLCDAIMGILDEDPNNFTGHMLEDETYLRSKGVLDFSQYQTVEGKEPPHISTVMEMVMGAGDRAAAAEKRARRGE